MWTKIPVIALGVILFTAAVTPATAHSLKNLEARLYDREKYFQPIEKQAPEFEIQDADGRFVRLADFHEKVVVLHFIYASCPDVCPLHAERIADIQQMVNQTPMKDQVQFISVTTDPENDTIEVLRDYGAAHGLDPVNWIFLRAAPIVPPRHASSRHGGGRNDGDIGVLPGKRHQGRKIIGELDNKVSGRNNSEGNADPVQRSRHRGTRRGVRGAPFLIGARVRPRCQHRTHRQKNRFPKGRLCTDSPHADTKSSRRSSA